MDSCEVDVLEGSFLLEMSVRPKLLIGGNLSVYPVSRDC